MLRHLHLFGIIQVSIPQCQLALFLYRKTGLRHFKNLEQLCLSGEAISRSFVATSIALLFILVSELCTFWEICI